MEIIEVKHFTLTCPKCRIEETVPISDSGSHWRGSQWERVEGFTKFSIQSSGGGRTEPEIYFAKCALCGGVAKADHIYGK